MSSRINHPNYENYSITTIKHILRDIIMVTPMAGHGWLGTLLFCYVDFTCTVELNNVANLPYVILNYDEKIIKDNKR